MKLFNSLLISATVAASTLGQTIRIGSPAKGTTVKAGSNITVQVNGAQNSTIEAAVVIGLLSCSPPCPPPAKELGQIIYNGPYFPSLHLNGNGVGPGGISIYQNLTVTIPADTPAGPAQLSVTQANFFNDQSHLVLISDEVLISVE
ncbi:hypothetical protein MVEN_00207000 [Mycena venus]|uniref:Uncharacterized protein n=1 Tax=Mycena venus TaxID=2733690 RepID=A0A8H7DE50_9AGAR|nr:hypothetical protein MVEN_00207000 [Mycena venus]